MWTKKNVNRLFLSTITKKKQKNCDPTAERLTQPLSLAAGGTFSQGWLAQVGSTYRWATAISDLMNTWRVENGKMCIRQDKIMICRGTWKSKWRQRGTRRWGVGVQSTEFWVQFKFYLTNNGTLQRTLVCRGFYFCERKLQPSKTKIFVLGLNIITSKKKKTFQWQCYKLNPTKLHWYPV